MVGRGYEGLLRYVQAMDGYTYIKRLPEAEYYEALKSNLTAREMVELLDALVALDGSTVAHYTPSLTFWTP